ncbi:NADH-quinone oxidoreductase subunit NuoH [Pedobacter arcticus]|uniref:NADH-quinone oxidoreductase subunit NuoH n=1 Tax=Pedobacter arcticus TaxID=752140 RepID=UPI0002FFEBB9|nr:NADH-quinone oxidoreductase subunit NuoH [Pedobacter arcticus]
MEVAFLIEKTVLVLVLFTLTLSIAAYSTWLERKVAAWLQDRVGPNRAGIFGLLQPLADGGKMFFKEEIIPSGANKWLFIAGPSLALLVSFLGSAVLPFGQNIELFGRSIPLQVTDINVGILYIFGVVSLGVYGIMIGGWASNNKYSLMGAIRGASQNISYEIAMGLSIIALLLVTNSLSFKVIAEQQHGWHWNILVQPLGFLIFLICSFAETNRVPFDLPECETELIGGYQTEYSGFKMGAYMFSEYINMFVSSAVMAVLYFGGYNYPGMDTVNELLGPTWGPLIGVVVMFAKIIAFIFFFMWVRWTVPRFRYDQLMDLGWKVLIPLAIANIVITAIVITIVDKL